MQIPAVNLNSLTAAPITPREDPSFGSLAAVETGKRELNSSGKEKGQQKQTPTFAKLSECDSDDDDIPLSELTRLSPTPASVTHKRIRASSPTAGGRPTRRLVSSMCIILPIVKPLISEARAPMLLLAKLHNHPKLQRRSDFCTHG